jgi:hypothetical protein
LTALGEPPPFDEAWLVDFFACDLAFEDPFEAFDEPLELFARAEPFEPLGLLVLLDPDDPLDFADLDFEDPDRRAGAFLVCAISRSFRMRVSGRVSQARQLWLPRIGRNMRSNFRLDRENRC